MVILMSMLEPFRHIWSTAFKERVQLADKVNEIIDVLNNGDWGIDEKVSELENKVSELDIKTTELDTTVHSMGEIVDNVDSDITSLYQSIEEVTDDINSIQESESGFDDRITTIENNIESLESRIKTIQSEINEDWVFVDFQTLGVDYFVTRISLAPINKLDYRVVFIWNHVENYNLMTRVLEEHKGMPNDFRYVNLWTSFGDSNSTYSKKFFNIGYDILHLFPSTQSLNTVTYMERFTSSNAYISDVTESLTSFTILNSLDDIQNIDTNNIKGLYVGIMVKGGVNNGTS